MPSTFFEVQDSVPKSLRRDPAALKLLLNEINKILKIKVIPVGLDQFVA